MKTELLLQLKRVIAEVPPALFDLDHMCGTARCAIGHAYNDPWFRENTKIVKLCHPEKSQSVMWPGRIPVGEFFDISADDAGYLFLDYKEDGVNPEAVLKNIDRVLNGLPAICYGAQA